MPRSGTSARRLAAGPALAAVLLLAGCWDQGPAADEPEVAVDAMCAEIEEQLTARDDIAASEVWYQDTLTVPASAAVDVTPEPGADLEALADEAVRSVWLSRIEPLNSITVEVANPPDPPSGISRIVDLLDEEQRAAIESEYGPRPG